MVKRLAVCFCTAVLGLSLAACGSTNSEEAQRQSSFVDAVETGIADWSDISAKKAGSIEEQVSILQEGVDVQAKAVKKFKPKSFEDESFAKLVKDYKAALDMESDGLVNYPNDPAAYNDNYVKGCKKASSVVKVLEDKAGLKLDDDHSKALSKYEKAPQALAPLGQAVTLESDSGEIEVSVDSFAIDATSTQNARENDGFTDTQNYGYLLCTITNESIDPKKNDYINLSELVQTRGADGIDLTSPNFSYEWPGYDIATGGYLSTMPKGSSKKVAIPYVTNVGSNDYFAVLGKKVCFVKAQ